MPDDASPPTSTSTSGPMPTADEAIAALVRADGNYYLAAERLHIERHELVAIIAQDQTAADLLNTQLRTLTVLRTFETFNLAHIAAHGALSTADPKDLFKLAGSLGDALERLTAPRVNNSPAANINITEYILKLLPEDIRESVIAMLPSANGDGLNGPLTAGDPTAPIQLNANRPAAHLRDAQLESETA